METKHDLWAGMRIPIIMVSGPVNSGKTLFALTIDPNTRRPATDTPPTTIVWDQEGSADSYAGALNFEHRDTRAAVGAGVHMERTAAGPMDPRWRKILLETADCNDNPAASMFRAWYLSLLKIPIGQYAVGICDTFTPLQDGLAAWLKMHPEAFGRSAGEYQKIAQATLWPDIKAVLGHILATDCRTRFGTFILNAHLKPEWANGARTGRQVAEGLDVLEKLATLHLELDRSPKEKNKEAPRVPAALVRKERLVRFGPTADDDRPILPPRIPACTPDAIRRYIAMPPDFARLEPGERLPDQSMSDDEKLRIQAAIAENQRAAEDSKLSALEIARRAAEQGRYSVVPSQPATPVTPSPITPVQAAEMMALMRELFASGLEACQWLAAKHGTADPNTLTEPQAMGVLADLCKTKAERQAAATKPPSPTPPADSPTDTAEARATQEQRDRIRELTTAIHNGEAASKQAEWLRSLGLSAAMSLTYPQAQRRIVDLERVFNLYLKATEQIAHDEDASAAAGAPSPF
jgi:hypothetical protein